MFAIRAFARRTREHRCSSFSRSQLLSNLNTRLIGEPPTSEPSPFGYSSHCFRPGVGAQGRAEVCCMFFALSALGTGGHDNRLPFHLLLPDSEGHRENITNLLVGVLNLRKSCLGRKLTRGEQPLLRRKSCPHDFDLSTLS